MPLPRGFPSRYRHHPSPSTSPSPAGQAFLRRHYRRFQPRLRGARGSPTPPRPTQADARRRAADRNHGAPCTLDLGLFCPFVLFQATRSVPKPPEGARQFLTLIDRRARLGSCQRDSISLRSHHCSLYAFVAALREAPTRSSNVVRTSDSKHGVQHVETCPWVLLLIPMAHGLW